MENFLISQALVRRVGPSDQHAGSPLSPVEKTPFSAKRRRRRERGGKRKEGKKKQKGEGKRGKRKFRDFSRRSSFPSLPVLKIVQQIDVSSGSHVAASLGVGYSHHLQALRRLAMSPERAWGRGYEKTWCWPKLVLCSG